MRKVIIKTATSPSTPLPTNHLNLSVYRAKSPPRDNSRLGIRDNSHLTENR